MGYVTSALLQVKITLPQALQGDENLQYPIRIKLHIHITLLFTERINDFTQKIH